MTVIAVCPRCQALLAMPEEAPDAAHLQCPLCETVFTRVAGGARPLNRALVAEAPSDSDREAPVEAQQFEDFYNGDGEDGPPLARTAPAASKIHSSRRLEKTSHRTRPSRGGGASRRSQGLFASFSGYSQTSPPTDVEAGLQNGPATARGDGNGAKSRYATLDDPLIELDAAALNKDLFVSDPIVDQGPDFVLHPSMKRRRHPSELRKLVGMVFGGVIGILLGGYILLWMRPDADLLRLKRWLPARMLPSSVQAAVLSPDGKSAKPPGESAATTADGGSGARPSSRSEEGRYNALLPQVSTGGRRHSDMLGSAQSENALSDEPVIRTFASEGREPDPVVSPPSTPVSELPGDGAESGELAVDDSEQVEPISATTPQTAADSTFANPRGADVEPDPPHESVGVVEPSSVDSPIASARPAGSMPGPAGQNPAVQVDPEVSLATSTVPANEHAAAPASSDSVATGGLAELPAEAILASTPSLARYPAADLAAVLPHAEEGQRRFLSGQLTSKKSISDMGKSYIAICELAERLTLAVPAGTAEDLQLLDRARLLFRATLAHADYRDDVELMAGKWLQFADRKNQGILLTGRVRETRPAGRWIECVVEMEFTRGGTSVQYEANVLVDETDLTPGSEAAFAGAIVVDPQQRIGGYEGEARQVVVAGYAFAPDSGADPTITTPAP